MKEKKINFEILYSKLQQTRKNLFIFQTYAHKFGQNSLIDSYTYSYSSFQYMNRCFYMEKMNKG